ELERAKTLNAQHMNARYMLGLVYDKQGKTSKALEEFRAIMQANQNSAEIATIVANLEAGKPALAGLVPAEPPIAETPPEISGKEAAKKK
ncbi:MAG: tetratricopeptide repeat protein, partial [Candidatus Wildermuthbacteria bacterium]|nr:tetratricopeptide repeat protein [Candidatus Wildermuthbacteria bacterium]